MEKGIRAFFYDYKYYMFPDGVSSLKELKARKSVDVKRLNEIWCMAPDFVYESIVDEHVEFDDPDKIFEVFVNLYEKSEYDALLREQVKRVCQGCEYFEDDGEDSLDGHYREIALNGTCYIREEKNSRPDYAEAFVWYWGDVATKLDKLAACIDGNDQAKLNEILNEELSNFFFKVDFFGAVIDGKYTLCMENVCGAVPPLMCLQTILAMTATNDGSPIKQAGWKVLPYLPEGIKYCDCDLDAPIIKLESPSDERELPFTVKLFYPQVRELSDEQSYEVLRQLYCSLASLVGEPVLLMTTDAFAPTNDDGELISLRDAAKRIKAAYDVYAKTENLTAPDFPPQHIYGMQENADLSEIAFPFRDKLLHGASKCLELSCLTKDVSYPSLEMWKLLASFAYIVVPRQINDPALQSRVLSWYFANDNRVPLPIRDSRDFKTIGLPVGLGLCGENGYLVDYMIVSEKAFFRKLRIIAPVLKAYGAKVVILNKDGVAAYNCDYEFEPIEL